MASKVGGVMCDMIDTHACLCSCLGSHSCSFRVCLRNNTMI
jgi:hypothetical protein